MVIPFGDDRGISPIVGIAMLIGLLMLMVAVLSVGLVGFGSELSFDPFDEVVTANSESADGGPSYTYGDNITSADDEAGTTTRHIVTLNVTGNAVGNSLNQVTIDYMSGQTNVSDTAAGSDIAHLLVVGLDTDDDGEIDVDTRDDVEQNDFSVENSGSKLVIELTGNYNLNADDKLVIVYEEVINPSSSGTYNVDINLNGDRVYDGALSIN
jgi:hypothetical protein